MQGRRNLWLYALASTALFFAIATVLLRFDLRKFPTKPSIVKEKGLYYDWHTVTAFKKPENCPVNSTDCLCQSFPKHLLDDIQPVLKTGHGVVNTRIRSELLSCSACLDDVLIFSDLDDVFEGHNVINVIEDIPKDITEHDPALSRWRDVRARGRDGTLAKLPSDPDADWSMDRFKFLAGISRAWRARPERKWYVFFEGDTFVVWDTVFRLLENFDPDTPHYFGSPSPGRIPERREDKTWFANGGPGYIISRAAMRRLVKVDWDPATGEYLGSQLSAKWWDEIVANCCGDSSLGWVLWNKGVSIEGLWPMFNPHPLHNIPFSDLYWCAPMLSLHKSRFDDAEKFWRWEFDHRPTHRPLLYRDVALSFFNMTETETLEDHDNASFNSFKEPADHPAHASKERCRDACLEHKDCFQWTYHKDCTFVWSFSRGQPLAPQGNAHFISGWNLKKIKAFVDERRCEQVEWVRPSIERIF